MPSFETVSRRTPEPGFVAQRTLDHSPSQWTFSSSELKCAPSILEGMPPDQEWSNRSKGVNFITQVGILLKLPQLTLATASVYLHRFFMRHSMVDLPNRPGLHHYSVAATALFLATKVEENCRKMRELIVACCRVAQKQPNLVVDEQSKEYWKWRDTILHNEDLLLEALCFDLQIEQPYRILYDFLCYYQVQENKQLRNSSWAFLNDSHVTTMCLQFSPRTIAGAAIYAGARWAGVSFPDDREGRPWWEHLELDVFEIQQACNIIAEVYENSALPRKNQENYFKDEDSAAFDMTRSGPSIEENISPPQSVRSESQGTKRGFDDYDEGTHKSVNGGAGVVKATNGTQEQLQTSEPSPKRQRGDSSTTYAAPAPDGSRVPVHHSLPPRPPASASGFEDVQQRIDDIVKASGGTQQLHPPLSRRNSIQRRPVPVHERSSSASHDRGGSSSRNSFHKDCHDQQPVTDGRQRQETFRTDTIVPARNPSGEPQTSDRPGSQRGRQTAPPVQPEPDVDESEQVDYGSEEGEL